MVPGIGVDLTRILGDAWRAPKVGRCGVGWSMGRGFPSPADYGVWRSVDVSSPSGVQGRAPAENGFRRILKATERSFLYLYDKNLWRQFALASSVLQILGTCSLRPPPVIYAHGSRSKKSLHLQTSHANFHLIVRWIIHMHCTHPPSLSICTRSGQS